MSTNDDEHPAVRKAHTAVSIIKTQRCRMLDVRGLTHLAKQGLVISRTAADPRRDPFEAH